MRGTRVLTFQSEENRSKGNKRTRVPEILLRPPLPPELFPGISCFKAMFSPTHIPDPVQFTAPTQHGK
ncbi:hypothetical protein DPEC_G00101910 [Dallia pectoralis]|uniref:Uncharacterized protein n=1 Tax=Dallia pectoralis TaxID=75939 RepID=A0ACC2GX28_DALPE|nr:hypothetical protein DPEC_G00101910 [Dallia pectoralis]